MTKLSVVLATRNEEKNIGDCIESFKDIADEIVIFDEESTDKTRDIAKRYGAKVYVAPHEPIFHITKQKAIDKATGDWILQMDADERVSKELAKEILYVIGKSDDKSAREIDNRKATLFKRHQDIIEQRDGKIGIDSGEVVAYFLPRVNFFLGKPLIHAGVYPDGVIRLIKKGKARLPGISVHEQFKVDGKVSWLFSDLEHHDSPTLFKYLDRLNRYTDLSAKELAAKKTARNWIMLIYYSTLKPAIVFLRYYLRHGGYKDGMRGFLWSFFSATHFPIAYFKYWETKK